MRIVHLDHLVPNEKGPRANTRNTGTKVKREFNYTSMMVEHVICLVHIVLSVCKQSV